MSNDLPQTPWAWIVGGIAAVVSTLLAAVRYLFKMLIASHAREMKTVIEAHDKDTASRDVALEKVIRVHEELAGATLTAYQRIAAQLERIEGIRRDGGT